MNVEQFLAGRGSWFLNKQVLGALSDREETRKRQAAEREEAARRRRAEEASRFTHILQTLLGSYFCDNAGLVVGSDGREPVATFVLGADTFEIRKDGGSEAALWVRPIGADRPLDSRAIARDHQNSLVTYLADYVEEICRTRPKPVLE